MKYSKNKEKKRSRFPISLFAMYLGVLLLMAGVHTGVLVLMDTLQWNAVIQSIVPIGYWTMVAIGLTVFTRKKIKETYEEPMLNLADAAMKVSHGDFSVYVPTIHTSDQLDYLDRMILDFNKMIEELGSIETLKTDFVSNVSHEMKTPIAVIKNYAELLKKKELTEKERVEYAESIEQAARRLSNLISNILKLNKLENQSIVMEMSTYDVCRQLTECILFFEEAWDEKKIELEVELEETAKVYGDENLMELVWNNLLSNAIKFTEPGGRISVTQRTDKNTIKVSIADTGCGMSRACVRHIFDKFYQGDTSHSKEGNGLGLTLVKRVVELMDGDIQVISEEGKGSTFTVLLPINNQEWSK